MGEELIRNIYERLGGIEAKLDGINQVRDTAQRAESKADDAQDTADKALEISTKLGSLVILIIFKNLEKVIEVIENKLIKSKFLLPITHPEE